jgi:4-hydroxy-tetrahydrodipicolinate synthase
MSLAYLSLKVFNGIVTPIISVFDHKDMISDKGLREQVDFLVNAGIDNLMPCGSTGEFVALSDDERRFVVKTVVDEVNGRIPVLPCTAADSTKATIEHSRFAQDVGAEGVIIVPPFYSKVNEEEVFGHFRHISESIDIPIVLYNNPARSMIDVQPQLVARLVESGCISYVKESSGDVRRIIEIVKLTNGRAKVFIGIDTLALPALAVGATGWVSPASNVIPRECSNLYRLVVEGKIEEATRLFLRLYPFLEVAGSSRLVAYLKGALQVLGRNVGPPRLPLTSLTANEMRNLEILIGTADLSRKAEQTHVDTN